MFGILTQLDNIFNGCFRRACRRNFCPGAHCGGYRHTMTLGGDALYRSGLGEPGR
jgi:hypothetical protein